MIKIDSPRQKGLALVTTIIMTFAIMVMATGTLYFLNLSTNMSGAGKKYATALEAADGSVDLAKETINLTWAGSPPPAVFTPGTCPPNAIVMKDTPCQGTVTLPAALNGTYQATITITRLSDSISLVGGRIEFPPDNSGGGAAAKTAVLYRIATSVVGPDNTMAENSVLYRHTR